MSGLIGSYERRGRTLSWIILSACLLRIGKVLRSECSPPAAVCLLLAWSRSRHKVCGECRRGQSEDPGVETRLACAVAASSPRSVSPSRCSRKGRQTAFACSQPQPQSHSIDRVLRYFQPVLCCPLSGAALSFPLRFAHRLCRSLFPFARDLFPRDRYESGETCLHGPCSLRLRHPTSPFNGASARGDREFARKRLLDILSWKID